MRTVVVNLQRATQRREQIKREFEAIGLAYEVKTAIDGTGLTDDHFALVDRKGRRRLGLPPSGNGSIACWLTYREVMQDLVANGPEMIAIFQDDALLAPELPDVLRELERKRFPFDVVALHRRRPNRTFVPCHSLTSRHDAGRVQFSDAGAEGLVISRVAACHFLKNTPQMVLAIDQALLRFWKNGLSVFFVNPAVVQHRGVHDSFILGDRVAAKRRHRETDGLVRTAMRRAIVGCREAVRKRTAWRKLLRSEIGVTRWP